MLQAKDKYNRKKTLIMGIGNLLMGDEGIGIHVIRRLQKKRELADIEIIDGGTGGIQLLDYFIRHELVILVDAAMDHREPGTVNRLKPIYSKDYPQTVMVHDIGLKDILDALYLLEKTPEIVLFTISISKVDKIGMNLSPKIRSVVPRVAEKIKTYLESVTE
jgi:hydrogenase maturation protease